MGNREYQAGMAVRRWDYRSWARLGRPIVREYTDLEVRQATLLVDTFADADGPAEHLEELLSLAASVCDTLSADGVRITLMALGTQLVDLASVPSAHIVPSALDRMAAASLAPSDRLETWTLQLRPVIRPGQAVIVVLNAGDDRRRRFLRELNGSVAKVTIVSMASRWVDQTNVPDWMQLVAVDEFLQPSAPSSELRKRRGVLRSSASFDAPAGPSVVPTSIEQPDL